MVSVTIDWKFHISARLDSAASHLAYWCTIAPPDIGRISLCNIHIHAGIDISLLMSCSVILYFVMHPANVIIQHISSSLPSTTSLTWRNNPGIAEMKAMDCSANNGLEKMSGSQELSGAYKSLRLHIYLSVFLSFSLYQAERVHRVKWWATKIPPANWRMPLQGTTEGCDARVSLIPLIRWHGTQNKRSSNPHCTERQALLPSCHAGPRNISQALSSPFKYPFILHSCAPRTTV